MKNTPRRAGIVLLGAVCAIVLAIFGAWEAARRWELAQQEPDALHVAARLRRLDDVKLLLRLGADPNAPAKWGRTPLHFVPFRTAWSPDRTLHVVEALLEAGADPNILASGGTPLLTESIVATPRLAEGADRFETESAQQPPLRIVKAIIEHGADPGVKDRRGWSPLMHAAARGRPDIAELLIDSGAPVGIFEAVLLEHAERIHALLREDPSRVSESLPDGVTPLMMAARHGALESARILIGYGAGVDAKTARGQNPLHYALARGGSLDSGPPKKTIEFLLENGADVNTADVSGQTPLHYAINRADYEIVRLLIEAGADPNARDQRGTTPLHSVIRSGGVYLADPQDRDRQQPDKVRLLISAGADVNAADRSGRTALHNADFELAKLLIDSGADPTAMTHDGQTAVDNQYARNDSISGRYDPRLFDYLVREGVPISMWAAMRRGSLDEARQFLETYGVDAAASAFWSAVRANRSLDVIQMVLESGFDPDALMFPGGNEEPLFHAARNGHEEVARLLILHGADVNAGADEGLTPWDVATSSGHHAIARMLEMYGGRPSSGLVTQP